MQFNTTRFGSISVDDEQIVTFSEGLPGFEETRRYALIQHPGSDASDASPFRWLQCIDEHPDSGSLAFPVVSPWLIDEQYAPTIPGTTLRDLNIDDIRRQAQMWAIVTIPRHQPQDATVNLLAPVLINKDTRRAKQVVLLSDYSLRHALAPRQEKREPYRRPAQERALAVSAAGV